MRKGLGMGIGRGIGYRDFFSLEQNSMSLTKEYAQMCGVPGPEYMYINLYV